MSTSAPQSDLWLQYAQIIFQYAILSLTIALRNLTLAFNYAFQTFPQATAMATSLVLIYIAYRLLFVLARMVYSIVMGVIRTLLIAVLVLVCIAVYFRGNRFFTNDCYVLLDYARLLAADSETSQDNLLVLKRGFEKVYAMSELLLSQTFDNDSMQNSL
ncbi:hypothetical protein BABINDRAFT_136098 [Babjeviella inositovora NRRL Y-12698]|uniref:Uncharacterized protein n=1 Tax=Babjeviella inositovora NRRL Y-12698 TaxID=984486 RepID=A0A1E3QS01_9ASCO|nr:uncharacterized protein BABINDRAFT_136098 [Babjeviella inositovora NRRL Y-12698]ODQ79812.1 hypothetical protein BABINDRAFT_136098 [Babjeviella inositovora NRRL Y-12698]